MSLRVLMMGTGAFAQPTFRDLLASPHTVVGLVTQPDRTGRGHHRHVNPLKEIATEHGVPVFQPERVNRDEALAELTETNADIFVVAAYGQILSEKLLAIPRLGAVNLHASRLPKYRGAAPIQYAVRAGETETGVSLFQIVRELDAGPVFGMTRRDIPETMTSGELHDLLAEDASELTLRVLAEFTDGTAEATPQPNEGVSFAPKIAKSDGLIDWTASRQEIQNHLRAMQPWPKPFTFLHSEGSSKRIVVLEASDAGSAEQSEDTAPGTVVTVEAERLTVRVGDGLLSLDTIQPDGKRPMPIADYLRGHAIRPGDRFLSET